MSVSERRYRPAPLAITLVAPRRVALVRRALPQPLPTRAALALSLVLHAAGAVVLPRLSWPDAERLPEPDFGVRQVTLTLPAPADPTPRDEPRRAPEPLDPPPEPAFLVELLEPAREPPPRSVAAEPLAFDPLFRPVAARETPPARPPLPPPPPLPRLPERRPAMEVRDQGDPVTVVAPISVDDNPPPRYPALAQRRGQEGQVVLLVRVDLRGRVLSLEVVLSSGHALLDRAALEAVRGWRFRPAREGELPVAGETEVAIRFVLVG